MKKITTKLTIFAAALMVIFSSCTNECELPISHDEYITIQLRVEEAEVTTRMHPEVTHGTPVTFSTGDLYLISPTGQILHHFPIVSVGGASGIIEPGESIARTALTAGVTLQGVRGRTARVVIVGNTPGNLPNIDNNITEVTEREIHLVTQTNISNVNLINCPTATFEYNSQTRLNGDLIFSGISGNRRVYSTNVHLAPTVARFEVGSLVGMAGCIVSFTLHSIATTNVYYEAQINGEGTKYFATDPFHLVTNLGLGSSLDLATGNPTVRTSHPTSGPNLAAFQLFAGTRVPHIIFALENVKVRCRETGAIELLGDRYLTINNFHINSAELLTAITAGYVYGLSAIKFDIHDLADEPNVFPERPSVFLSTRQFQLN